MRQRTVNIFGLATLAGLLAGGPLSAEQFGGSAGVPQPLLLRISGFVGRAPQGTPSLGSFTVGVDHQVITLDLSAVQTLNGPLTEGPAALRQYDLYTPNLLLVGNSNLLRSLTDAMPHTLITLFGYVHPGARRMLVVHIETA
jgi:hypothetical protein